MWLERPHLTQPFRVSSSLNGVVSEGFFAEFCGNLVDICVRKGCGNSAESWQILFAEIRGNFSAMTPS